MIAVEISNQQSTLDFDEATLVSAARCVLKGEAVRRSTLSIAVVDGPTMFRLNRQYLKHDYVTDVLSFQFIRNRDAVEGEVIVCADVAADAAPRYGWDPVQELLLYVVHGVLHLVGYDDASVEERSLMRQRERHYLSMFGIIPRYVELRGKPVKSAPTSETPKRHQDRY